ncbi:MAG: hypothetical protein RKL32_13450, partial [Gammaproteobacteria bacterium]
MVDIGGLAGTAKRICCNVGNDVRCSFSPIRAVLVARRARIGVLDAAPRREWRAAIAGAVVGAPAQAVSSAPFRARGLDVIYQLDERRVVAEGDYFVADSAAVIGSVLLKKDASIWFGAVLRGDNDLIT